MSGSPVTCGGNESIVAGFLINNATCSSNDSSGSLSYHSVSQFAEWILDPSRVPTDPNTAATIKLSIVFMLFAVLISFQ